MGPRVCAHNGLAGCESIRAKHMRAYANRDRSYNDDGFHEGLKLTQQSDGTPVYLFRLKDGSTDSYTNKGACSDECRPQCDAECRKRRNECECHTHNHRYMDQSEGVKHRGTYDGAAKRVKKDTDTVSEGVKHRGAHDGVPDSCSVVPEAREPECKQPERHDASLGTTAEGSGRAEVASRGAAPPNTMPGSSDTVPSSSNATPGSSDTTPGSHNTVPGGSDAMAGSSAENQVTPPAAERSDAQPAHGAHDGRHGAGTAPPQAMQRSDAPTAGQVNGPVEHEGAAVAGAEHVPLQATGHSEAQAASEGAVEHEGASAASAGHAPLQAAGLSEAQASCAVELGGAAAASAGHAPLQAAGHSEAQAASKGTAAAGAEHAPLHATGLSKAQTAPTGTAAASAEKAPLQGTGSPGALAKGDIKHEGTAAAGAEHAPLQTTGHSEAQAASKGAVEHEGTAAAGAEEAPLQTREHPGAQAAPKASEESASEKPAQPSSEHVGEDGSHSTAGQVPLSHRMCDAVQRGIESGGLAARRENEQRLHLTPEAKAEAIMKSVEVVGKHAAHEGATELARTAVGGGAEAGVAQTLGSVTSLPIPTGVINDGQRAGLEFAGGHEVSFGRRVRTGEAVRSHGASTTVHQVEHGVQFRLGVPKTAGLVGVGGTFGRTETSKSVKHASGNHHAQTTERITGYKGGVDIMGVQVLRLDTGKVERKSAEHESTGLMSSKTVETHSEGLTVLGVEHGNHLTDSKLTESGLCQDRHLHIDHSSGAAVETTGYGPRGLHIVEVTQSGHINPEHSSVEHAVFREGSTTEVHLGEGGHMLVGAGAAGVIEGACDFLDGEGGWEAAGHGVEAMVENFGVGALMEVTGMPMVDIDVNHVQVSFAEGFALGVGHEARNYHTPEGEMHQETSGVQLEYGIGPLQVVQARAAVGHTVDHISSSSTSHGVSSEHEETCTTDGAELQLSVGNWSTDAVRIGHIQSKTKDTKVKEEGGNKTKTVTDRDFDGYSLGVFSSGSVHEVETITRTPSSDAASTDTLVVHKEFNGDEHGISTGIFNSTWSKGEFKETSEAPERTWTDDQGAVHHHKSSEVFQGEQHTEDQSAFFGAVELGHHETKTGTVHGTSVSNTSSDTVAGGKQVLDLQPEHGDMCVSSLLTSTTIHGQMHYDASAREVVFDSPGNTQVTLSAPTNCAIAAAAGVALRSVVSKGYLDTTDVWEVCKAGVKQFCLLTAVSKAIQWFGASRVTTGTVTGLISAVWELRQIYDNSSLAYCDKVGHAMVLLGALSVDILLYMVFATNPYLMFFISLSRLGRDVLSNTYDYYCGNLTLESAWGNCCSSTHMYAAAGACLGAKAGAFVGFLLGPLSMGLGMAIGGALGSICGALAAAYWFEAPPDKDLQYAYTFLGVDENSSDAEVKSAYHAKALVFHPDRGGTSEAFQLLQRHYEKVCASRLHKALCSKAALKAAHCAVCQD